MSAVSRADLLGARAHRRQHAATATVAEPGADAVEQLRLDQDSAWTELSGVVARFPNRGWEIGKKART